MRSLAIFCAIISHFAIAIPTSSAAEPISVRVGEAKVVSTPFNISSIVIGSNDVVDLNVDQRSSLIITGVTAGRSNVIVLGTGGDRYDLDVVVQSDERDLVFIHNGTNETVPFRCHSRCERLNTAESSSPSEAGLSSPDDTGPVVQ